MTFDVRVLEAGEISRHLRDLARLRIEVFREWPYLYDGDAAYERDYLMHFAQAPDALLVAAFEDGAIVGMATASPMSAQSAEIRQPVDAAGLDSARIFYFGESVLLARHRGHGIGHAFFDHREAGARAAGAEATMFCAVLRSNDHPLRPADAPNLHGFWTRRGYAEVPGVTCHMSWRDVGAPDASDHELQFWSRKL